MWKSFQSALRKSVKRKNGLKTENIRLDKYSILEIIKRIIKEDYGQEGLKNIQLNMDESKQNIIFICKSSVWKSEMMLKRGDYLKKINLQLQTNWIKNIKFWR